jgi:hypothetical protein
MSDSLLKPDCPGSRWWKFDFHTHTPASTDYGRGAILVKILRQQTGFARSKVQGSSAWRSQIIIRVLRSSLVLK